ncbi:MAG: metal-dependent hydrolase [Heliobacteriaceae bacterium]|jgi:L-ascorbate metabolism protein UlaG (beta-lactamase superfamily)|nr:metal-dependent hydrolase [Heliobacteriaceae bacterium]
MDLKYIGHSAFEIQTGKESILVDPFVSPEYDWKNRNITDIFITHGHSDHIGQAVEIAKFKNANITAVFEVANYCAREGARTRAVNLGGWLDYEWGRAVFLPAAHSSSLPDGTYGGIAASIVFDVEGIKVFHAGDTALTSEMKIIKELYRPAIALLPVGGNYTMDVDHAAVAAEWLGAQTVIPMHYDTFPEIKADLERFTRLVQSNNKTAVILNPHEGAL